MNVKKTLLAGLLCVCLTLPAAAQTFTDVPLTHWAYANIEEAAADGAVKGYQDGSFAPGNPLSLAHFTVILTRSFYGDELDRISANPSASWYSAAESVAQSHGLLKGVDATMDDPLSRYQMALEIRNLLEAQGCAFLESAAQEIASSIQDWNEFPSYSLRNAVACVYSLGILGGYSDGKFHGENILNRAQAAAIYCRLKNVLANFAPLVPDGLKPTDSSTPDGSDNRTPDEILEELMEKDLDNLGNILNDLKPTDSSTPDGSDNRTPDEILEELLQEDLDNLGNILNGLKSMDSSTPDDSEARTPDEILEELLQEDRTPDDSQPETVSDEAQQFREEVLRLVNEARAEEGLSKLTLSDELVEAAQIRAEELPDTFSHTRPDGSSCFTVLSEVGVRYMATGENIAAGQRTPADVMDSWMNSPGHRANILSENYSKLGVGVCKDSGGYGVYWVQLFTD